MIQKLQNLQIGAVFVLRMSLMLLAKRDESHLMLWGMKQLLTNRVTTVVAALAQGSDPKHSEAAVALQSLWAQ